MTAPVRLEGGLICLDTNASERLRRRLRQSARARDCDDGNDAPATAASPTARFTCSEIDECSDGNACNGNEAAHTAEQSASPARPPPTNAVHERSRGEGECRSGTCVPRAAARSCGGRRGGDDGNQDSGDGCERPARLMHEDVDCTTTRLHGQETATLAYLRGGHAARMRRTDGAALARATDHRLQTMLVDADGDALSTRHAFVRQRL